MRTAKELRKIANHFNINNKLINSILNQCESIAKAGYYSLSFNNYKVNDVREIYGVLSRLEELGYKTRLIKTYKSDWDLDDSLRASFIVKWS